MSAQFNKEVKNMVSLVFIALFVLGFAVIDVIGLKPEIAVLK